MTNRYDENRERFEGGRGQDAGWRGDFDRGYQNRGYGQPGYGQSGRGDWSHGNEGPWGENEGRNFEYQGGADRQNYENRYGRSGNAPQFDEGNRGFGGGFRPGQDWDRYRERSMAMTYPRQSEWSSGYGISSGLGGAENSEYSSYPRAGNLYFGQGPYGGSLNQYGSGTGQYGGGLNQYGEQGRHVGRGPKGYKRSDERIREDVNERLTQDPQIDASDIEVQVKDGEVTLTGTVDSRQNKRRAEDLVENLSGVRDVHNQLRAQVGHESHATAGTQNRETATAGTRSGKA